MLTESTLCWQQNGLLITTLSSWILISRCTEGDSLKSTVATGSSFSVECRCDGCSFYSHFVSMKTRTMPQKWRNRNSKSLGLQNYLQTSHYLKEKYSLLCATFIWIFCHMSLIPSWNWHTRGFNRIDNALFPKLAGRYMCGLIILICRLFLVLFMLFSFSNVLQRLKLFYKWSPIPNPQ